MQTCLSVCVWVCWRTWLALPPPTPFPPSLSALCYPSLSVPLPLHSLFRVPPGVRCSPCVLVCLYPFALLLFRIVATIWLPLSCCCCCCTVAQLQAAIWWECCAQSCKLLSRVYHPLRSPATQPLSSLLGRAFGALHHAPRCDSHFPARLSNAQRISNSSYNNNNNSNNFGSNNNNNNNSVCKCAFSFIM